MSIDQVANGVRGLARMHGQFWGARLDIHPTLGWLEPFVAFQGMRYAPLHIAHERLGDTVPAEIPALSGTELFVDIWARYIGTLTGDPRSPQTLLHGDPHIGNTYVLPGDDVGFLDWQMARRGNWSLDLGYFLQGALTIEDRRRAERDLLAEYRDALALPADELPSAEGIWLRYRASVAHGLAIWMATLSGGDAWQSAAICLALAQRYSAAFVDLESRSALETISR
jgi:aminoglycoside phosphotransferase (APT) family kinase protein